MFLTRTKSVVFVALTALLSTGCSKGFESKGFNEAELRASYGSENPALQDYLIDIEAIPVVEEVQEIQTTVNRVEFLRNMDITFGNISRIMGQALNSAQKDIWPNCSTEPTLAPDYKKEYRCGEVPYGKVLNSQEKLIMEFPIDAEKGESGGAKYEVYGLNVPLYLDRNQKKGTGKIKDLTQKKMADVPISDKIMENLYVRLSPDAGNLEMEVCFFIPGLKVYSGNNKIYAKANKKVLFINLKASANVDIDPGTMQFDKSKVCLVMDAKMTNKETKVTLKKPMTPELTNFRHTGIKVDADFKGHGILGVVMDIAKLVGFNIERKIEKKIKEEIYKELKQEARDFITEEVKNGAWFKKMIDRKALDKIAEDLESELARINNSYGPGAVNNLNVWFKNGCRSLAKKLGSGDLYGLFDTLCRQSFELEAHLFEADPESKKMGCYDHFFQPQRPREPLTQWWAKNCRIDNKLTIRTPENLAPIYACITEYINTDPSLLNKDESPCAYELSLLIDESDREAIIAMKDLADQIKEHRRSIASPSIGDINKIDFFNMVYENNF